MAVDYTRVRRCNIITNHIFDVLPPGAPLYSKSHRIALIRAVYHPNRQFDQRILKFEEDQGGPRPKTAFLRGFYLKFSPQIFFDT